MYNVQDLVFEVGRKCNLECPHCLRGCSQNVSIEDTYIIKVLENIKEIGTLTITGGEPFLYPKKIKFIVDEIIKRGISVSNFFVATNGLVKSMEVVFELLRLYEICDEKDMCGLKISMDEFHTDEFCDNDEVWELLKVFSFTYVDTSLTEKGLLSEGRAEENMYDTDRKPSEADFELLENDIYGMVYVNALGSILKGCDYSYNNQEYYSYGNLNDSYFTDIVEAMA